jgi:hypothetical protein
MYQSITPASQVPETIVLVFYVLRLFQLNKQRTLKKLKIIFFLKGVHLMREELVFYYFMFLFLSLSFKETLGRVGNNH